MVPEDVGGAEAPIETALGVFEELAYADGSTGWSVMANASSSAFAAIYCGDDAAATMFPAGAPGIHAGHVRPGRERDATDDGYVLRQLPIRQRVRARDVVRRGRDGDEGRRPVVRPPPASRRCSSGSSDRSMSTCAATGTSWGSRARAATTTRSTTQFVDDGFTFRLLEAEPARGGAMYRIGLFGLVASGHAGFALGVGKRALVEVLAIAETQAAHGQLRVGHRAAAVPTRVRDARRRDARRARYVFESFGAAEAAALADGCHARPAAAHAAGDDLRDPRRGRRGALRVHLGGHRRAAKPERRCNGASATSMPGRSTSTSTTTRSPATRRRCS